MTVTVEAIVGTVTFCLSALVGTVVWLVRLEGKVKSLDAQFDACVKQRDRLIAEGKVTEHDIQDKLDELLREVSEIKGQLSVALNGGKGKK